MHSICGIVLATTGSYPELRALWVQWNTHSLCGCYLECCSNYLIPQVPVSLGPEWFIFINYKGNLEYSPITESITLDLRIITFTDCLDLVAVCVVSQRPLSAEDLMGEALHVLGQIRHHWSDSTVVLGLFWLAVLWQPRLIAPCGLLALGVAKYGEIRISSMEAAGPECHMTREHNNNTSQVCPQCKIYIGDLAHNILAIVHLTQFFWLQSIQL